MSRSRRGRMLLPMTRPRLISPRRRRAALLALALFLAAVQGCAPLRGGPHPSPARGLAAGIDSIIGAPPLDRTHWGIEVFDPASGRVLYAHDADQHFIPASNTKLVATTTAMALLGPDFRYETPVYALTRSGARDSVATGLVIVGSGDPTLSDAFTATHPGMLAAIADSVRAAGIRRIDGDLVVDASAFEERGVDPSWELGDLIWYYAAPINAFAVAEGTRRLVLLPGYLPGQPAGVRFLGPDPRTAVQNDLMTGPSDARRRFNAERRPGIDTLFLAGIVPAGAAPDTQTLTVVEPAAYAGRALRAALAGRGIPVSGAVRVVYDTAEARALGVGPGRLHSIRVADWTSPPLAEIVTAILRPSDNWMAEQVLKTIGLQKQGWGSWRNGIAVEDEFMTGQVGVDSAALWLRDGSGLSAQDLLTPAAIVRILSYVRTQPWAPDYMTALAAPGLKGSTLSHRLTALEGRLHAKTGSITHVNSLSGYLRTDSGRELVFSILSNGSSVPAGRVRAAIDAIVTRIASEGANR